MKPPAPVALTAELVGQYRPGSPEWHAARENALGGSEAAAMLGLSPWESPYSLWHRKAGLIGPVEQTDAMKWGHRFEDDIVEEFEERHPEFLVVTAGTYRNTARPWQIANPDRLIVDRSGIWRGLEIKTALRADDWGPTGTDEIPVYYRTQVMHYMDTLGLEEFILAVLFLSGWMYREYRIAYDPTDAQIMRDAGIAFMDSLVTGQPPDLDDREETYRVVKERAEGRSGESVEIPASLAVAYNTACAQHAEVTAAKRLASARILAAIGDGKLATCNGLTVAMRTVKADGSTHSLQPAKGI